MTYEERADWQYTGYGATCPCIRCFEVREWIAAGRPRDTQPVSIGGIQVIGDESVPESYVWIERIAPLTYEEMSRDTTYPVLRTSEEARPPLTAAMFGQLINTSQVEQRRQAERLYRDGTRIINRGGYEMVVTRNAIYDETTGWTPTIKVKVREWLVKQFRGEQVGWPEGAPNLPGIYVDGKLRRVEGGYWEIEHGGAFVFVGRQGSRVEPFGHRVAVCAAIASELGVMDGEVEEAFVGAVGRAVCETFDGIMKGLVKTVGKVSRLAWGDGRCVAEIDGRWRTVTGEELNPGAEWTIVEYVQGTDAGADKSNEVPF